MAGLTIARWRFRLAGCGSVCAAIAGVANAAIVSAPTPAALDAFMGMPLLAVPADGAPVGAIYGHPPSLTPGMPLPTPIGPMGFGPSHERLTPGSPFDSGAFLAIPPTPSGIAGSTVYAPTGATAIDLFLSAVPGAIHTFEITAVGTATTATILVPAVAAPTYVGFGAFGETITLLSIVKLPFPTPTTTTWVTSDIRVLPTPPSLAVAGILLAGAIRRRRRP